MSERYNIPASDVLGENYNITSIECSDYNPNIDNSITVTITVKDVYGDAVSGESVLVTASEGNFTQLNGSNITNASSVTGTTNSSGQFTLTYSCTEWGLITFSANTTSTQIRVTGWRVNNISTGFNLKYNESIAVLDINVSSSLPTSFTNFSGITIPSDLRPGGYVVSVNFNNADGLVGVEPSGNIQRRSGTGSQQASTNIRCTLVWNY